MATSMPRAETHHVKCHDEILSREMNSRMKSLILSSSACTGSKYVVHPEPIHQYSHLCDDKYKDSPIHHHGPGEGTCVP